MRLTFLGHQGWLVSLRDTHILVDPLLWENFGHTRIRPLAVYPPRKVYFEKFPKISAVILSHEHLDHFHIPSLGEVERSIPVICGAMLPAVTKEAVEALGFSIKVLNSGEPLSVGDIRLRLYSAGSDTVNWERNVYQILLQDVEGVCESAFIAVDALTSEEFVEDVARGVVSSPSLYVVSNNSQVLPEGAFGANTNLLPYTSYERSPSFGLDLLSSILQQVPPELGECKNIVICGNGYHDPLQQCGPFLYSDNKELARQASSICSGVNVMGPYPGEQVLFESGRARLLQSGIVAVSDADHEKLLAKQKVYKADVKEAAPKSLLDSFITLTECEEAMSLCAVALDSLAVAILISDLGTHLFSIREYFGSRLGDRRLVIYIEREPFLPPIAAILSFSKRKFELENLSIGECIRNFPCGITVFLRDFIGMLAGEIQVWEMLSASSRSWYVGDKYNNLPAFFISFYGEHHSQNLARLIYAPLIDAANRTHATRLPTIFALRRGD